MRDEDLVCACVDASNADCQVSVVIPFFNLERTVIRCLDSVLSQTFKSYEVICVDDGSIDSTGSILDNYAESHERVRVFHEPNGGVSEARNIGVRLSRGEYITFVDGDDIVSPYYLEVLVNAMAEEPEGTLAFGGMCTISEAAAAGGIEWAKPSSDFNDLSKDEMVEGILAKKIATTCCCKLATRAFYLKHPFNAVDRYDEALIAPVVEAANRFREVPSAIYGYVMRRTSMIRTKASNEQAIEYACAIINGRDQLLRLSSSPAVREVRKYWDALYAARFHATVCGIEQPLPEVLEIDSAMRKESRKNAAAITLNSAYGKANRVRILLYLFSPAVHDFVMRVYSRLAKGI